MEIREQDKIEYIGMIETNEGVLYIEKHNFPNSYTLVAGTACNIGLLKSDSMKGDDCFSLDENLQDFVETLTEKYGVYEDEH